MNKKVLIMFVANLSLLVIFSFLIQCKKDETKTQINKSSSQSKEGVLLTAKEVYNQLLTEAKKWQNDAKAYKIVGGDSPQSNNTAITDNGKSSNWRFWFTSASKKEIRVYTFRKGEPYFYPEGAGGKLSYEASDWTNIWKIDSDKALEIAKKEGLDKVIFMRMYLKDVSFVTIPREVRKASTSCSVWWDIFGKDKNGNNKIIYIDASSGKVLK